MKISFVGYGNMAKALAKHLVKLPDLAIYASAPSLKIGQTTEGIHLHPDNTAVIKDSDVVILAVKPQIASPVLQEIATSIPSGSVLLSIATGLSLERLAALLPAGQAIIRSMPNMPVAAGAGATPLIANAYASLEQKQGIQNLFEQAGIVTWLDDELEMDRFTALSGSGPAYVFYFLQAMIKAGEKLGLTADVSKQFVLQTAKGALALAESTDLDLEVLRKAITAPAGTTAAAIAVFDERAMDATILEAIEAAFRRAQVLGLSI